jgi:hypothetical protein
MLRVIVVATMLGLCSCAQSTVRVPAPADDSAPDSAPVQTGPLGTGGQAGADAWVAGTGGQAMGPDATVVPDLGQVPDTTPAQLPDVRPDIGRTCPSGSFVVHFDNGMDFCMAYQDGGAAGDVLAGDVLAGDVLAGDVLAATPDAPSCPSSSVLGYASLGPYCVPKCVFLDVPACEKQVEKLDTRRCGLPLPGTLTRARDLCPQTCGYCTRFGWDAGVLPSGCSVIPGAVTRNDCASMGCTPCSADAGCTTCGGP